MPTNLASERGRRHRDRRRRQPRPAHRRRRGDELGVARAPGRRQAGRRSTSPAVGSGRAGSRSAPCCARRSRRPRPGDPQSRFSALRQFRVLACTAGGAVDCTDAATFRPVFTSPADAFPSVAPRPRAPELIVRSFDIPDTERHAPAASRWSPTSAPVRRTTPASRMPTHGPTPIAPHHPRQATFECRVPPSEERARTKGTSPVSPGEVPFGRLGPPRHIGLRTPRGIAVRAHDLGPTI